MPKCSYCDREVPAILQPEIDQGWGEVTLAYRDLNGKLVKEETIDHCPDHLQAAFNTVVGRVAQVQGLCIGVGLKHSIPLCDLVSSCALVERYVDNERRPEGLASGKDSNNGD